jgi:hypothetical protein
MEHVDQTIGYTRNQICASLAYWIVRQSSLLPPNLSEIIEAANAWLIENELVPPKVELSNWTYYVAEQFIVKNYINKMVYSVPQTVALESIDLDALKNEHHKGLINRTS